MAKQKIQYTHESVKLGAGHVSKVREQIKVSRQTICGFIEVAIDEKLQRDAEKENVVLERYRKTN